MDGTAANARSKAAAWAWYQRGSGSVAALVTARSEAALAPPHRGAGGSPSRFKLEADLLSSSSIDDATDRLERLHLFTNSANSSCEHGSIAADMLAPLMQQVNAISSYPSACTDLVTATSSSCGVAAWDCGSALFDSYELVAMSKKLDNAHQLNGAMIEKICPPPEDTAADTQCETMSGEDDEEEEDEEETQRGQLLHDSPPLMSLCVTSDTIQSLPDQKQSKQAIYDMFCQYDDPGPEGGIFEDTNHSSHEHTKKPKPTSMSPAARSKQYRKRHLHSLSMAFRQNIAQLAGHSRASSMPADRPPEKGHLHQSLSLSAEALTQRRPHYHSSTQAPSPRGGIKSSGSPFQGCPPPEGCGIMASNHTLRKHYSRDYVHHHHHHHYHHHHHHYLFRRHSDEGFGVLPEPLLGADKSLLVAAAGLGTTKLSALQDYLSLCPKLEGALLDRKRKLNEPNAPPSPAQFSSPPNLQV